MKILLIPLSSIRWAVKHGGWVGVEERDSETCQVWHYPK